MKKLILTLVFALTAIPVAAQQETLFDEEFHSAGYGGPIVKATQINGEWGVLAGGGGAWYVNHAFGIGLAGYGLASSVESPLDIDSLRYIDLGYGGATLEYVVNSDDLVHFSVNTLIGAGSVAYRATRSDIFDDEYHERNNSNNDVFFVVEPGANVELNVAKFMRVNLGASYRIVNGVELQGLSDGDIGGFSGNLMLKFGAF